MREETRPTICVICKLPIEPEERPSILFKNGDEAHFACWAKKEEADHRPN